MNQVVTKPVQGFGAKDAEGAPKPQMFKLGVLMNKSQRTFVLVADASRARLFAHEPHENTPGKFVLLEEFDHPASRAKVADIMADKPGRTFSSGPMTAARSAKEYRTDPKQVEAEKFVRELSRHLVSSFDAHAFDALVVAAPPKFLGLLRAALAQQHDHVSERVIAWHEKDYTSITDLAELAERLAPRE
jgi:protein required for attachment to host cells